MGNFFTASTMGELLQQLKTAERIRQLDADVAKMKNEQAHVDGKSYQKALRDVFQVRAGLILADMRKTRARKQQSAYRR